MKTQSCKAKGRIGQQEVCKEILEFFPTLEKEDVRSRSMGSAGEDIMLSTKALYYLPFDIEVKRRKKIGVCRFWEQAEFRTGEGSHIPLVCFREDGKKANWFATLKLKDFLFLLGEKR